LSESLYKWLTRRSESRYVPGPRPPERAWDGMLIFLQDT
jgi:hypothetical protein